MVAGGQVTCSRHPQTGSGAQTESTHVAPANSGPRAAQSASTEHCWRLGSTSTLHATSLDPTAARSNVIWILFWHQDAFMSGRLLLARVRARRREVSHTKQVTVPFVRGELQPDSGQCESKQTLPAPM